MGGSKFSSDFVPPHMGGDVPNFSKRPPPYGGGTFSQNSIPPPHGEILRRGIFLVRRSGISAGGDIFKNAPPPIWGGYAPMFKDLTHFLKVVSAEMKKAVEITIRTFQNSLFLCFYALEPSTVAFQHHFSTKSVRNRVGF